MKKINLEYNPFKLETKIYIEGEEISKEGLLYSHREMRLQEWLDDLFPELVKECNDDIQVIFKGTELDYEDVCLAKDEYFNSNGSNQILIELIPEQPFAKSADIRLNELRELFHNIQKDCPFKDLKEGDWRDDFQRIIESELEVSVIATMSGGKSTLINALLGRELMPSKAGACTATISHIKDIDGLEGFSAICKDKNKKTLSKKNHITIEDMEKFNSDDNVVDIYIEGDIPFVSSQNMNLILLDTPGPNNSRAKEHRNRTFRVIKDDKMPMVLYLLDAIDLGKNDDKILLETVLEEMKRQHGKQARDRFLFVLNKMDRANPEKEGQTVEDFLRNAQMYLSDNGIENAQIYPISAEVAKLIRMKNNKLSLDSMQNIGLATGEAIFSLPGMQLNERSPLSNSGKKALENDIKIARDNNSKEDELLVYTGVPAIEVTIAEYLEKYALTNKINEAVKTFKSIIEAKRIATKLKERMSVDEEERKKWNKLMNTLSALIKDGEGAKKFRYKLEQIDFTNESVMKCRTIRSNYYAKLNSYSATSEMTENDAKILARKIGDDVQEMESVFQADLEIMIEKSIIENAKGILDEYKKYIKKLLEDKRLKISDYDSKVSFDFLTAKLPDTTRVVNKYKEDRQRKVKVGEVEVSDSTWYKPWTWWDSHKEAVYESESYKIVKGRKVIEDMCYDFQKNLDKNIDSALSEAQHQAEEFKKYFMKELDKLDKTLSGITEELKTASEGNLRTEEKIKKNKMDKEWLDKFQEKLNCIINL